MKADFLLLSRRILGGAGATSLPRSHLQGGRPTRSRGAQLSHKIHWMAGTGPSYFPTLCFPAARSINIHWCNYFDFKFRNSLYKNRVHCNLGPGYDYKRRGFSPFKRPSSKQGETLPEHLWNRMPMNPRSAHLDASQGWGVEVRPTSKNLGLSPDENSLWQAKWEHGFHNRIQQTRLGSDVRTIQGFGSFFDAVKWELAGWLDTANDT